MPSLTTQTENGIPSEGLTCSLLTCYHRPMINTDDWKIAWLGDAAFELTPEQLSQFEQGADQINSRDDLDVEEESNLLSALFLSIVE